MLTKTPARSGSTQLFDSGTCLQTFKFQIVSFLCSIFFDDIANMECFEEFIQRQLCRLLSLVRDYSSWSISLTRPIF